MIPVSEFAREIDAELIADSMLDCFRSCISLEFADKNAIRNFTDLRANFDRSGDASRILRNVVVRTFKI